MRSAGTRVGYKCAMAPPSPSGTRAKATTPYNEGGAPIGGKGPVPEGFVAWVIGLGLLVVASRWIAGRG